MSFFRYGCTSEELFRYLFSPDSPHGETHGSQNQDQNVEFDDEAEFDDREKDFFSTVDVSGIGKKRPRDKKESSSESGAPGGKKAKRAQGEEESWVDKGRGRGAKRKHDEDRLVAAKIQKVDVVVNNNSQLLPAHAVGCASTSATLPIQPKSSVNWHSVREVNQGCHLPGTVSYLRRPSALKRPSCVNFTEERQQPCSKKTTAATTRPDSGPQRKVPPVPSFKEEIEIVVRRDGQAFVFVNGKSSRQTELFVPQEVDGGGERPVPQVDGNDDEEQQPGHGQGDEPVFRPGDIPARERLLEVIVTREHFLRNLRFGAEDHLYQLRLRGIRDRHGDIPYFRNILKPLDIALKQILSNLKKHYMELDGMNQRRQVYLALIPPGSNSLNTGNWDLSGPVQEISDCLLRMADAYAQSHRNIRVNAGFKLSVNVLGLRHAEDKRRRNPNWMHRHEATSSSVDHSAGGRPKGSKTKALPYILDLPRGFVGDLNAFAYKCVPFAALMALAAIKKIPLDCSMQYKDRQQFHQDTLRRKPGLSVNEALIKFITENKFQEENEGFLVKDVMRKVSNNYRVSVRLYTPKGRLLHQEPTKRLDDPGWPKIYLLQTEAEGGHKHVEPITRIELFRERTKWLTECCRKRIKTRAGVRHHWCKNMCFSCLRNLATKKEEEYHKDSCDSGISDTDLGITCPDCHMNLVTKHCQIGHKEVCGSQGYRCQDCNQFVYKKCNETLQELRELHAEHCPDESLICYSCKAHRTETISAGHVCRFQKERMHKSWNQFGVLNLTMDSEKKVAVATTSFESESREVFKNYRCFRKYLNRPDETSTERIPYIPEAVPKESRRLKTERPKTQWGNEVSDDMEEFAVAMESLAKKIDRGVSTPTERCLFQILKTGLNLTILTDSFISLVRFFFNPLL